MLESIKKSLIFRAVTAAALWFDRLWHESRIVSWVFSDLHGREMSRASVIARFGRWLHKLLCSVFRALRLDKLLRGSIFKRTYLWCAVTLTLAPILPTSIVIVLSVLSALSLFLRLGCDENENIAYAPANKFIILFMFIYIIATFTSVNPSGSLKGGVLTVFFALFSIILGTAVKSRRQLDILVYLMIAAGTLVAAYGVYQYLFGSMGADSWIDSDMFSEINNRVYSTLQNPNVLSEYLLLIIPVAFAFSFTEKNVWVRVLLLLCSLGMCLCMILTFSRGGYLGLLIAAAVFLLLADRRFFFAGILLLAIIVLVMPGSVVERFTSIGDVGDSSTSYRVSIWHGTIAMLRDYWVCGIGPGTAAFQKVYPVYSYSAAVAQHSHNLFLQITCDCGVCGTAAFILAMLSHFRSVGENLFKGQKGRSRLLLIASFSSVLGFLVQSMTDNSFYNYRVQLIFWAFLTLGALAGRRDEMPEVAE
ncbi:MAG: O-antigen ligase family protein [Oscillospiraceae bacterium]|nr:O-antigen ligase family protein [Oscillospiraceae bacterium]